MVVASHQLQTYLQVANADSALLRGVKHVPDRDSICFLQLGDDERAEDPHLCERSS
jgi:hypothetical protein